MAKSKAIFFGFNPPFVGGAQNVMSRQEDERLIKNDIMQLLLTVPGERVMRPSFGVNLRNFVFEQSEDNDLSGLASHIQDAIDSQEPRVKTDDVQVTRDDDKNGINIKIVAHLVKDPRKEITIERFLALR